MLNFLDDMDAKMQTLATEFQKAARQGKGPGEMTDRIWALDQRTMLNSRVWLGEGLPEKPLTSGNHENVEETLIVQIEPDIPRELSDLGVSGADSTENSGSSEALGEPVPQSLLFPK